MNKNYLINDGVISLVDFVTTNKKGQKTINKKYTYILNELLAKALRLQSIGCNFVVDTEFKNDTVRLNNQSSIGNSKYDKNSNTLPQKDIVNVFNLANLFLNDRQLLLRHNEAHNLIIQVVKVDAKLSEKSRFKRVKNSSIVTVIKSYDIVADKEIEEEEKTRSGLALFTDKDIEQAWSNFKAVNDVITGFTSNFKTLEEIKKEKEKQPKKTQSA